VEINATLYSETGYAGLDLTSFPSGFFQAPWMDGREPRKAMVPFAERWGVVIIDEFDKLRFRKTPDGRDTGRSLQAELLRITEGDTVYSRSRDNEMGTPFRTHHVLFIGVGAYEGLSRVVNPNSTDPSEYMKAEDKHVQAYGFMEELIGRFSTLVMLPPLRENHLYRIIIEHIWPKWVQQAEDEGFSLTTDDNALHLIANEAVQKRIGARGLEPLIEKVLWKAWGQVRPGQSIHLDSSAVAAGAMVRDATPA